MTTQIEIRQFFRLEKLSKQSFQRGDMRYHRYTEIQEIFKALTLMITVNTPDIIIDLSTERVIDVRVISFLLILPVSCSHFGKCLSLEFFRYGFIFGFDRYIIDVLVDTV